MCLLELTHIISIVAGPSQYLLITYGFNLMVTSTFRSYAARTFGFCHTRITVDVQITNTRVIFLKHY